MDNYLSIVSCCLFVVADVFAIASLVMPQWIISDVGEYRVFPFCMVESELVQQNIFLGNTEIGLLRTCLKIYNRDSTCFVPGAYQPVFILTFICIVSAVFCVTTTVSLLVVSRWKEGVKKYASWFGFVASK